MTDSRTLGQSVPKEGLFLMDGIEGLRSLPKHSVDMLLTDPPYGTTRNYWDVPLPLPEMCFLCLRCPAASIPRRSPWRSASI